MPSECGKYKNGKTRAGTAIADPAEHQTDVGALREKIGDLAHQIGATVLIERDVLHIGKQEPRLRQAISDSLRGNPARCLMRRNRSSSAAAINLPSLKSAADESAMEGVQAENYHQKILPDLQRRNTAVIIIGNVEFREKATSDRLCVHRPRRVNPHQ
jgi:hypothetical protein